MEENKTCKSGKCGKCGNPRVAGRPKSMYMNKDGSVRKVFLKNKDGSIMKFNSGGKTLVVSQKPKDNNLTTK